MAAVAEAGQIPWVEKYRPQCLDDVVSHEVVITTLKRFVASNNLPHLLLHGPPGTGKTSTVTALAKELYGPQYEHMCLELNASDERSIGVVRGRVKTFASSGTCSLTGTPSVFGLKLVVLDEADQLTHDAQMALRRIIEDYAATTRFVIICNFVHKVAPALQSRCCKFRFPPLPEQHLKDKLQAVVDAERLSVDAETLRAFVEVSGGDMRRAINMLQGRASGDEEMTADAVRIAAGLPTAEDAEKIWAAVTLKPFKEAFAATQQVAAAGGYASWAIVTTLHDRLSKIDVSPAVAATIYPRLASVEYRLAQGADEQMQLSDAVAAFMDFREALKVAKKNEKKAN